MEVIDIACDDCPAGGYQVSDAPAAAASLIAARMSA